MTVYICLIAFLVLYMPFSIRKVGYLVGEEGITNSRAYIIIASVLLIGIQALRGLTVGIDTSTYYEEFNRTKTLSFPQLFTAFHSDYGYRILEYAISKTFGQFQILLLVVAILFIGVVSYNVYKYSTNPLLSYIFFMGFGFFAFGMTAVRQTIAISLVLVAFQYIKKKKLIPFLIFVTLASTFHATAIIFFPSYWFNKFRLTRKSISVFVLMALLSFIFKTKISEILLANSVLLNHSYGSYGVVNTGGYRLYFMMTFSLFVGILYRKQFIDKSEFNRYLFFMVLAAVLILPITQFNPAVMRLYMYYSIFLVLYIPNLIFAIRDRIIRLVGIYGYSLTALVLFFGSDISTNGIQNYLFFWQSF